VYITVKELREALSSLSDGWHLAGVQGSDLNIVLSSEAFRYEEAPRKLLTRETACEFDQHSQSSDIT